ncbi:ABC transporter substrate-binding protein [Candidatus Avelusimicrobium stercoris]|uniref:ABC transporter substrate-binding protein n=1 Tax=Candidatus Avelusimicrobium stercoris TaxID=1947924 RepID=UPI003D0A9320
MKKCLLFLCAVLLFSACAKQDMKDTLVVAHKGEMESLDPVYSYDGVTHGLLINVYDTLLKFDGSSLTDLLPSVSTAVPSKENGLISADGRTYTFPIRKGIKFQGGEDLTPEDVRYSLLRFLLSDVSGGPSSLLLEPVLGVSSTRNDKGEIVVNFKAAANAIRVDGDNVVVTLKRPFAPFLSIIARWSYIVSKDWAASHGAWDGTEETWKQFNNFAKDSSPFFAVANGSGPFSVARWDIAAKRLTLAANENYFAGAPKLKFIHMLTVDEPSTLRLMLETGDADVAEISTKFAAQIKGNPDVTLYDNLPRLRTDPVIFFTLDINMQANPDVGSGKLDGQGIPADFFADKNLRQAFEYAFDYDSFLKESMEGRGERAIGPAPAGLVKYDKDFKQYPFDLKKAEELFKKAWGGQVWEKGFKFTITYNTSGDMRQIASEILKRNVESLNPKFQIDLRGVTWPSFLEKTAKRQMPMWARGWVADYADAHNFYFPFLHSQGRYALSQGYKNPQVDALIERAVAETNFAKRSALYKQVHNLMHEDAMQIYTVHPTGLWAMRKNVKGFTDNPVYMGIYFYPMFKE